jgi:hypothetical protein
LDPHHLFLGKPDPDPHQSEKPEPVQDEDQRKKPDSHQCKKRDPHQKKSWIRIRITAMRIHNIERNSGRLSSLSRGRVLSCLTSTGSCLDIL